jgi:hypothetical protein
VPRLKLCGAELPHTAQRAAAGGPQPSTVFPFFANFSFLFLYFASKLE